MIGSLVTECSELGRIELPTNCFFFSIRLGETLLFRGIIGFASILYTKQNQKFRESVLSEETINAVFTIRHSENSFSQIAIILFNRQGSSTRFASCDNVRDAVSLLMGEETGNSNVYHSETVNSQNLSPGFYCEDHTIIDKAFQNTQTKCLEELAEIIPGKSARSWDYRETGIPYLRARDIQNGEIVAGAVCLDYELSSDFSRQLLQEGDILLTKHFGQRKLALVSEANLPAIASEALFIIRPFGISERYLYRYLTSKTGNAVFNEQLKGIERGITNVSFSLSDLKKIQVPVYDDETMSVFEQAETSSTQEGLEAALRIIQSVGNTSGIALEKHVYNDLVSAGWAPALLTREEAFAVSNNKRWLSDLAYTLPDGRKVYFEIKSRLSKASKEWVSTIERILNGSTKCFYVLTTGFYYEVHATGSDASLKILHAPSIQEIIDWEGGLN